MPTVKANMTNVNYTPRGTDPEWIVIHNTSNATDQPPIAYNNTQYFKNEMRNASATYFIDSGDTIWQCVSERDTAWHCGEAPSQNGCHNYNSIGIEVCERTDGTFSDAEVANLSWLVKDIMKRYGIPASRIVRHHDVTNKRCPWLYSDDSKWSELKARILGDDEEMTDEQIEKLAKAIYKEFADPIGEDKQAIWGANGKNTGSKWRNWYNMSRWYYDLLVAINAKLDKLVKKLGA